MSSNDDDIREYLDKIAASKVMGRSARKLALLEYLLRAEMNGEGDALKGYSIGLDVFGKPADFDPSADSSVRVEMSRLRTAIALFEVSDMATSIIRVELPVGTYRPQITQRDQTSREQLVAKEEIVPAGRSVARSPRMWLALAGVVCGGAIVWGFTTMLDSGSTQGSAADSYPILLSVEDFAGDELGKEIANIVKSSFENNSVVKILERGGTPQEEDRYIFSGRVIDREGYSRVSAELADLATNQIVWNHSFRLKDDADLQGAIESELNGELYTRLFGAAKKSLELRDAYELTPQELFILATWVSGPAQNSLEWEVERVRLMEIALEKDPDYGPAHSVLADKYGFLANVYEPWDTPENLQLSRFHAERGAELLPLDENVMFNVAQSHWHAGRHVESQRTFKRVTELDPGHSLARFFAKVVPYWCDTVPDDVMTWAVDFDNELSSDDPIRWIVLTWIATLHANRGEYELGLRASTKAAQIFQVGYTYMARAMLLNKLGQTEAAAKIILRQRKNWPGIGPEHHSSATIPRLCSEQPDPTAFVADYVALTKAVNGRLD